jgi:hypothetical protein
MTLFACTPSRSVAVSVTSVVDSSSKMDATAVINSSIVYNLTLR